MVAILWCLVPAPLRRFTFTVVRYVVIFFVAAETANGALIPLGSGAAAATPMDESESVTESANTDAIFSGLSFIDILFPPSIKFSE